MTRSGGTRARTVLPVVLALAATVLPVEAQDAGLPTRETVAARAATAPEIDGEVLGDPAWAAATPTTGFVQTTPNEGEPATERTEVYIVFTDETLYFGVVCYDRTPSGIIVADSRRDSPLDETDSFQIILDTYRDLQTGFVFGTNPAGIEYDGQVNREGEGGFGTTGGFNINWDGSWQIATQISELGWTAEFAIPFRTLRYPRGSPQTWGLNFQRNIRRHNESAFWSPLPRQFGLHRVSLAGTLTGVEVPRQHTLQITPYALVEGVRAGVEEAEWEDDQEVGVDLKYGLSPSMTLDATYNTDFAQVEADVQQINLDRFSLFFPEKRPFFLENAGYFAVGVPEEVELFFSRRIGIGAEGVEIPILGGVRLSGKAGHNNLGLLYMRTDEVEQIAPEEEFAVVRMRRDLPNRSSIGAIVTSREGKGDNPAGQGSFQTYSIDGKWGIGRYGELLGFAALTDSPQATGDEHAFRLGGGYDSETWAFTANYTEVGEDFNPAVGFLRRRGYRKPDLFVLYRYRPESWWGLQELRPHVSYRGFWDFDGFQETGFLHVDNHWEWKNGYEIHTGVNFTREGVTEAFEIGHGVVVPEGSYSNAEAQIVGFTNQGAPVSFELRVVAGGFFDGDRLTLQPAIAARTSEAFSVEIAWTYNDVDLSGGAFEDNLGRLRLSYSFSPKIFLELLAQYNDRVDDWSANVRFGWLQQGSAGFYVVYNERQEFGSFGSDVPHRQLIIKYSRLFDLSR